MMEKSNNGITATASGYTVAVPVMNMNFHRCDREMLIAQMKQASVSRVFLALAEGLVCASDRDDHIEVLRENCAYLHAAGFEVGAWLWTFYLEEELGYMRMESPDGRRAKLTVCPTDPDYRREMGLLLREIAGTGVDLIMFDDDFRYGYQDMGFGCVCPGHKALIEKDLGESVDADTLKRSLLYGGKNRVRDAFLRANGHAFEMYAEEMRKNVDAVAPGVRMGFCTCITSWDLDGIVPDRLSRILAGNTKPFYRLIGAPYWAPERHWNNRLGDVIELERSEAAARKDPGIEIFSEGDTFPRPRFATPAAFLACFDTALRASHCTDGILAYMADYHADADYETGYFERALIEKPYYPALDSMFSGKDPVGVRVYDRRARYADLQIPETYEGRSEVQEISFSASSRFLTANSIPSVYNGAGVCGVAFGEDARDLPESALQRGIITDLAGALILREQGVDVGIDEVGKAFRVSDEIFLPNEKQVGITGDCTVRRLSLSDYDGVQSYATDENGNDYPVSYQYMNRAGHRFLIYAFNGYLADQHWFRSYLRAEQIHEFVKDCGMEMPVICKGHPELYILAAAKGKRLSVGLWNLFADPICTPVLELPHRCRVVNSVKCSAKANGNTVSFSMIPAFDYALVELEMDY